MIELIYQNGFAMVYKIEDWEKLRKQYRIIGDFFGTTQYVPSLPLQLLPEETYFLLQEKLATLTEFDDLKNETNVDDYQKYESELVQEQIKQYERIKREQVELMIDKIIEGKRKKGDERSKEEIIEEEVSKIPDANESTLIWPISVRTDAIYKNTKGKEISLEEYSKQVDKGKCAIFMDLWKKDYYITSGSKFGSDFLVYPGDPLLFHAIILIRCIENENDKIPPRDFVAFGRLGTTVKKKPTFAHYDETTDKVSYISIDWAEN